MPDGFEPIALGDLLRNAQKAGNRFATDEASRGVVGADFLAETIAHGAKFRTALQAFTDQPHLQHLARELAEALAHYIITGEVLNDRIAAAAARCGVGVGHA